MGPKKAVPKAAAKSTKKAAPVKKQVKPTAKKPLAKTVEKKKFSLFAKKPAAATKTVVKKTSSKKVVAKKVVAKKVVAKKAVAKKAVSAKPASSGGPWRFVGREKGDKSPPLFLNLYNGSKPIGNYPDLSKFTAAKSSEKKILTKTILP